MEKTIKKHIGVEGLELEGVRRQHEPATHPQKEIETNLSAMEKHILILV